jgi:hypothetical protein
MLDELCEDHGYERKYAINLSGEACHRPVVGLIPGRRGTMELNKSVVQQIWLGPNGLAPGRDPGPVPFRRWVPTLKV